MCIYLHGDIAGLTGAIKMIWPRISYLQVEYKSSYIAT